MTANEFKKVLYRHNFTLKEASHHFDRSVTAIRSYMTGDRPIPRTIEEKIKGLPHKPFEEMSREELIEKCQGWQKSYQFVLGKEMKANARIKELQAALNDPEAVELGPHSRDPLILAWVKKRNEATAVLSDAKLGSTTEKQMRETILEYERLIGARLKRLGADAAPKKEKLNKPGKPAAKKEVAEPAKPAYRDLF